MDDVRWTLLLVAGAAVLIAAAWRLLAPHDERAGERLAGPAAAEQNPARERETMYERVGAGNIRAAVDQFYHRILGDPRLAHHFDGVDLGRLRRHQALLIGQILGGPVHFELHQLAIAHRRLRIDHGTYWITVGHLLAVLTGLGVPRDVVLHLCAALYDAQDLIITDGFVPADLPASW